MIAPLAKEDFEDLQAEGLAPTLEDFDRLNSLALRFQKGKESTAANAPRCGWAGDIPFYEPTYQALSWYLEKAERITEDAETKGTLFAFACHFGRTPNAFDFLETPSQIEARVKQWASTLPVTREEVERAVHYASCGFDDAQGGQPPQQPKSALMDEREVRLNHIAEKMNEGCILLGLSFSELWLMTPSRLDDLVVAWHIEQDHELKADTARIDCEYKAALREIRNRLLAEKSERESAEKGETK